MDSLVLAAFLVGVAGGVHCVGMCGGIVAAVALRSTRAQAASPGVGVLAAGGRTGSGQLPIQLAFNLGRVATYGVIGGAVGAAGSLGLLMETVFPVQLGMRVIASALVILVGLHVAGYGSGVIRGLERAGGGVWRIAQRLGGGYFPPETAGRAILAGGVWGWLPCGLVYGVLATALVSGSPARGASIMLAFGLGTLPALLAAGMLADRLRQALQRPAMRLAAGGLVVGLGVVSLASAPGLGAQIRAGVLCLT
jgi:sulfite exporter TauE/SafE